MRFAGHALRRSSASPVIRFAGHALRRASLDYMEQQ
jgi:hypothetical protein